MPRKNQSHRKNIRRSNIIQRNEQILAKAEKDIYPPDISDQIGETDKVKEWKFRLQAENARLKEKIDGSEKMPRVRGDEWFHRELCGLPPT